MAASGGILQSIRSESIRTGHGGSADADDNHGRVGAP
jgi:hypothetical protein